MKNKIYLLLPLLLLISCTQSDLKKLSDDEVIRRIVDGEMPDPSTVNLFDWNGNGISFDSLTKLEVTRKYFEEFFVDESNEIVKVLIRPRSPEDEPFFTKLNEKMMEGPPLRRVEINCDDKVNILQDVFDRDQGHGQGRANVDPQTDHENLEIIVSFLDKCGMPTLADVDDVQMAAIWAVLQHAPPSYQSKYIPLLEEAADNGDIKWGVIAMMKDRALMYEGKPQVYGTQVSNGQLYELEEAEYVNQRRAAIGMDPIEDYLRRFGVEFNVEQKQKEK